MRFSNKTALITGGGTCIGAAVARRVAGDGGNVILVGRRREPLDAVAAETGGMVIAADGAAMRGAVSSVVERYGAIDISIANAGGHGVGPTISMSDDTWSLATRVNGRFGVRTNSVCPG